MCTPGALAREPLKRLNGAGLATRSRSFSSSTAVGALFNGAPTAIARLAARCAPGRFAARRMGAHPIAPPRRSTARN